MQAERTAASGPPTLTLLTQTGSRRGNLSMLDPDPCLLVQAPHSIPFVLGSSVLDPEAWLTVQADIVRFPPNVSMTKRGLAKMSLSERSPIVSRPCLLLVL